MPKMIAHQSISIDRTRYKLVLAVLSLTVAVLIISSLPTLGSNSIAPEARVFDESPSNIILLGHFETENVGNFPKSLSMVFTDIRIRRDLLTNSEETACVTNIDADFLFTARDWDFHSGFQDFMPRALNQVTGGEKPICVEFHGDAYATSMPIDYSSTIEISSDVYYDYPYDHINLESIAVFEIESYDEQGNLVRFSRQTGSLAFEDSLREWEIEVGSSDKKSLSVFMLRRPILIRYLTALLLIPIFLLPAILPLVDSLGTAVEIAIVILLGLWGTRQILLGESVPGLTRIDILLLGQYGIITFSLLSAAYLQIKRSKNADQRILTPSPDSTRYMSLPDSQIYHKDGCVHIENRPVSEMKVYENRDQAERLGKRRCKTCIGRSVND